MPRNLVRLATVLAIATVLEACHQGSGPTDGSGSTVPTTPGSLSPSPVRTPDQPNPVVGEWARINSCDAFVDAFERAGLDRLVPEWLVSAGYFLRADQVSPAKPCEGAVEDRHSYFFQRSGRFGSLDQDGVLVDDGTYAPLDDGTIAIVGVTSGRRFRVDYRIADDRIRFHVSMPPACTGECKNDLAWVLSMFYPGALTRAT
jgi:hypothetical protein